MSLFLFAGDPEIMSTAVVVVVVYLVCFFRTTRDTRINNVIKQDTRGTNSLTRIDRDWKEEWSFVFQGRRVQILRPVRFRDERTLGGSLLFSSPACTLHPAPASQ